MEKRSRKILISVIVDILVAALIVGGWPISRQISLKSAEKQFRNQQAAAAVQTPSLTPVPTLPPEPTEAPEAVEEVEEVVAEEPEPTEDPNLTEWQRKFKDKFTDEVIVTDTSYTSPNISINITSHQFSDGNGKTDYYVADIYIASIDCLQSYFARGYDYPSATQLMPPMMENSGAIIGINGDYCYNVNSLNYRNGVCYSNYPSDRDLDIFILLRDGSARWMTSRAFNKDDYAEGEIYQLWCFGPNLLNDEGRAKSEEELVTFDYIAGVNPRSAIGYFEPGHYCFVAADGRSDLSVGLLLSQLGQIFEELGCAQGYNLDGGGSSMLMYGQEFVNISSVNGMRDISDIIIIKEPTPEIEP